MSVNTLLFSICKLFCKRFIETGIESNFNRDTKATIFLVQTIKMITIDTHKYVFWYTHSRQIFEYRHI